MPQWWIFFLLAFFKLIAVNIYLEYRIISAPAPGLKECRLHELRLRNTDCKLKFWLDGDLFSVQPSLLKMLLKNLIRYRYLPACIYVVLRIQRNLFWIRKERFADSVNPDLRSKIKYM